MKLQNYKISQISFKILTFIPIIPTRSAHISFKQLKIQTSYHIYTPNFIHSTQTSEKIPLNSTQISLNSNNFGFIFHLIPQNTTRRGNWAGRGTAISNTRWRTNAQLFPLKILTFQDRFSDSSLIPFPPISNNKYSLFTSNILIFKHKYSHFVTFLINTTHFFKTTSNKCLLLYLYHPFYTTNTHILHQYCTS